MSEQNAHKSAACPEDRRHRLGRRARLTVAAITLVGIGAVLGTAVSVHAARTGGWHAASHHWRSAKTEEQVRQIARRHGGDARYLPREGGGSCFEVTLAEN